MTVADTPTPNPDKDPAEWTTGEEPTTPEARSRAA